MPLPRTSPEVASRLRRQLDDALVRHDKPAAVAAALDAVHAGEVSIPQLYVCVLGPLLADIGASWQHGVERVWEEHLASMTVYTIVEALYPDVVKTAGNVPARGETAVLACPADEDHDLGLRMLADRMTLAGWTAHFLGADTPDAEISSAAAALAADLVVLSVATHYNRVALQATVDRLKREVPGVRVAIGGPAFGRIEDWPEEELVAEAALGIDFECGS